jgi:hypothetical protein
LKISQKLVVASAREKIPAGSYSRRAAIVYLLFTPKAKSTCSLRNGFYISRAALCKVIPGTGCAALSPFTV